MLLFVTIIHFIVAVLLVTLVLLQDSKGGGAFGMGSSGSNQVLSATGAANFLVTMTRTMAILFALTCISLTYLTTRKSSSVVDDLVPQAASQQPPTQNTPAEKSAPAKKTAKGTAPEQNPAKGTATPAQNSAGASATKPAPAASATKPAPKPERK